MELLGIEFYTTLDEHIIDCNYELWLWIVTIDCDYDCNCGLWLWLWTVTVTVWLLLWTVTVTVTVWLWTVTVDCDCECMAVWLYDCMPVWLWTVSVTVDYDCWLWLWTMSVTVTVTVSWDFLVYARAKMPSHHRLTIREKWGPHIQHELQYFPNEETKSQRDEEKFLCHSEQLTERGWEGTPNGQTPGLGVSTPNLFHFFFSRGALGILESCSCPTL